MPVVASWTKVHNTQWQACSLALGVPVLLVRVIASGPEFEGGWPVGQTDRIRGRGGCCFELAAEAEVAAETFLL